MEQAKVVGLVQVIVAGERRWPRSVGSCPHTVTDGLHSFLPKRTTVKLVASRTGTLVMVTGWSEQCLKSTGCHVARPVLIYTELYSGR